MPYYLETDNRELLNKLRQNNLCAICGAKLEAFYDVRLSLPYLQCKANPAHDGIAKEYQEPRELNISTRRDQLEQEHGREASTALEQRRLPTSGALNQNQAMAILKLVYPQVPEDEIIRCAILCRDFGLHPLLKEIYIIPFGQGEKRTWSTVLGINATRKLMARRGTFSYVDNTPRIMTEAEEKSIFGEIDADNITAITKLRTRKGLEAQGYGKWPRGKDPYGVDKGNTKANMAFIRSERNAFGRLFTDAIPQDVEIIDEAYAEVPQIVKVDTNTGEIIEGKAVEVTGGDSLATSQATTEDTTGKKKDDLLSLEFKDKGEFYTACLKYFNLQKSTVEKEIPEFDLAKPGQRRQAWQQLVGIYKVEE